MSIDLVVTGHVAEITLNRPHALNALSPSALVELNEKLIQARDDSTVRVILLTGRGDKAFCTGADLKDTLPPDTPYVDGFFASRGQSVEAGNYARLFNISVLEIEKPLIAAVNGYCVGGGLELALQCDLRVASTTARFGLTEPVVGSIPAVGGVPLLLRAIPAAAAMRMLLTGEKITAQKALSYGLVSDVWEPEALLDEARTLAATIASNAPTMGDPSQPSWAFGCCCSRACVQENCVWPNPASFNWTKGYGSYRRTTSSNGRWGCDEAAGEPRIFLPISFPYPYRPSKSCVIC